MATGAHGSSLWGRGSSVHDYAFAITIVTPAGARDGYAMVRKINSTHADFNVAKVSLGVLGVITQVRNSFIWMCADVLRKVVNKECVSCSYGTQHYYALLTQRALF